MEQTQLIAGDSLNFYREASGYLATAGWTLRYRLVPRTAGGSVRLITGTPNGAGWDVQAPAIDTASWAADVYAWAAWVEQGAESYTVAQGQLEVLPNPRTITAGADTRSATRKAKDDTWAAYLAFDPSRRRYVINGREMEFNSQAEILTKYRQLEVMVAREERAAGQLSAASNAMGGRIYIRAN